MTEPRRRLVERITHPAYLEGLRDKTIDALRGMREECRAAENEISFERRLCHARIDILNAELDNRSGKGNGSLMDRLPQILGSPGHGQGSDPLPERAPDFSIPRSADIPRRRVEEIVGEQTLARLSKLQPAEIKGIVENLEDHEAVLSTRRQGLHEVMDALQQEIVRRYASGEADPTTALP
jgi:hypothetical protein